VFQFFPSTSLLCLFCVTSTPSRPCCVYTYFL
jgi:hypothetical protein